MDRNHKKSEDKVSYIEHDVLPGGAYIIRAAHQVIVSLKIWPQTIINSIYLRAATLGLGSKPGGILFQIFEHSTW
jgi:hypothetical protein